MESQFEDGDEPVVYMADEDLPEYDIERGDHVVISGLSGVFSLQVVKHKDQKSFVKLMSCGALDRMTLLSGRLDPAEPSLTPQPPFSSRRSRRGTRARPK